MSTELIEQKLADIERRLAALEGNGFERKPKGAWRDLIGWEKDDETFREAVRLGAEWRQRMNEEGK